MIRRAESKDLSRIAEIQVFNYRLYFYPKNAAIGTRLLEYAVNERHADHLWVLEKNTKAIRFYERNGFVDSGEKKLEEGTTEYLLLLKREKTDGEKR